MQWRSYLYFFSTDQSLTGANVKQEGELPIVLGWFWLVDGPARGDLGGVNFDRNGCLGNSPRSIGVAFSDEDDDDDDDDESEADELWLSSPKLRWLDSHEISVEQLTGEMSQSRLDGLTPGSTKPSDGPTKRIKMRYTFCISNRMGQHLVQWQLDHFHLSWVFFPNLSSHDLEHLGAGWRIIMKALSFHQSLEEELVFYAAPKVLFFS